MITHVSIKMATGAHNLVSAEEFAKYPLTKIVSLVSKGAITCLNENGEIVKLTEGLKYIRSLQN